MKTIDIKGKPYVEVHERITFFRDKYPEWSICPEWIKIDETVAICKANIIDEKGVMRFSGTAMEVQGNGFINKFSHIENCETSAVGRALGIMGIGIDTSIASYDEVANAVNQQSSKKEFTDDSKENIAIKTWHQSIPKNLNLLMKEKPAPDGYENGDACKKKIKEYLGVDKVTDCKSFEKLKKFAFVLADLTK